MNPLTQIGLANKSYVMVQTVWEQKDRRISGLVAGREGCTEEEALELHHDVTFILSFLCFSFLRVKE